MKNLIGHVSAATAFVQPDYPYSFTLRCERRVWIETRKGFGMRVVTQTVNPKTGRVNAAKPGIYHVLAAMSLVEEGDKEAGEIPAEITSEGPSKAGHVLFDFWSPYDGLEKLEAFAAGHPDDPATQGTIEAFRRAYAKKAEKKAGEAKIGEEPLG